MVLARGQQGNNYFDNLSAMFYEYFVDFDLYFCVSDESGRALTRILKTGVQESFLGKSWSQNWKGGV